jgi:hypothetical protein
MSYGSVGASKTLTGIVYPREPTERLGQAGLIDFRRMVALFSTIPQIAANAMANTYSAESSTLSSPAVVCRGRERSGVLFQARNAFGNRSIFEWARACVSGLSTADVT